MDWDRAVASVQGSGLAEHPSSGPALPDPAGYQRIDAADLGDMDQDPFARKAEAYDVKLGWRQAREH